MKIAVEKHGDDDLIMTYSCAHKSNRRRAEDV